MLGDRVLRGTLLLATLGGLVPTGTNAQGEGLAARSKGHPDAPVTVYEMSDFQCPYCRHFALATFPELEREYVTTGKVRFIYINFPLTNLHAHAARAAAVALCAARQGKFWPVHDILFQRQPQWEARKNANAYFLALADSAGADTAALARCLAGDAARAAVDADAAAARRTGARSTPSFFVEGELIEGDAPASLFRQVLDSIYQSKTAPPR